MPWSKFWGLAYKIFAFFMRLTFMLCVVSLAAAAVYFADDDTLAVLKANATSKSVRFLIALVMIILGGEIYAWRFGIDLKKSYDTVESNPVALAQFLGLLLLGFCMLAAAVYG